MTTFRANLGAELRRLRAASGMTQVAVAEATGLAQSSVAKAERGQLGLDALERLLAVYRATLHLQQETDDA